jgi:hypothetical protein
MENPRPFLSARTGRLVLWLVIAYLIQRSEPQRLLPIIAIVAGAGAIIVEFILSTRSQSQDHAAPDPAPDPKERADDR